MTMTLRRTIVILGACALVAAALLEPISKSPPVAARVFGPAARRRARGVCRHASARQRRGRPERARPKGLAPEGAHAVLQGLALQSARPAPCAVPARLLDCERDLPGILR
jgi:hypothetical protein